MNSSRIKILLDSTVFRDLDFIEWLQGNSILFDVYLSVIVYLETYHWYNLRGISKTIFDREINTLKPTIIQLEDSDVADISSNVISSKLMFKHHVRDIIIATHAISQNCLLITHNKKHFAWMKNKPMLPDELIELLNQSID